ncbi:MAG: hypothetical protein JRI31_01720 [Deltaproteobacteria bacterium]|nr:hypothetical protein [Deltaproteobacteria bacterium]
MDANSTTFLELEQKLLSDKSGELKKKMEALLMSNLQEVKRKLDAGLPPREFNVMKDFKEALESCLRVLNSVWGRMHEQ